MPGKRLLRTVVGLDYGVSDLNRAVEPVQRGLLDGLGTGGSVEHAESLPERSRNER